MWTHRRSGSCSQNRLNDHRNPYERDLTRVIHCPSFRRLQRKTQILGTEEGDFHRTRLTHSLEVASIGRSIVRNLAINYTAQVEGFLPNDDLINVICLLHDIGHPPFGHGGEAALNFMMRDHGGFEGNGQTLRLLTKLEKSYGAFGLDLTRRALLGVLKYPVPFSKTIALEKPALKNSIYKTICINDWLPPKAYYDSEQTVVEWLLEPFNQADQKLFQSFATKPSTFTHGLAAYHSFDCAIMDIADDIAYGVHDLEDAIHLRLIHRFQLDNEAFKTLLHEIPLSFSPSQLINALFSEQISERKQAIGELVNYLITSVSVAINHDDFENPLLKHTIHLQENAHALLLYLKNCITTFVINSQDSRTFEFGGQTVVLRLFEAIHSNPLSLLDENNRGLYQETNNEQQALRVICDYIANMTDEHAYRFYERLFGFNTRAIF